MIIRVIDFETTGIPSEAEKHSIVEIGFTDIVLDRDGAGYMRVPRSWLIDPGRPIPPQASAIHHITQYDVVGMPKAEEIFPILMDGADVFAAHNAPFDRQFFGGGDKPWIDTLRCAKHVWPDAPGFSNQVLRYWLNLVVLDPDASPSHRAGPDTYVTAHILHAMLVEEHSPEGLIAMSSRPVILQKMPFGKHAGQQFGDIPVDYLRWVVNKSNIDDKDVMHTARHHLRGRS